MAAIERVIPLVSHLPQSIRDALTRRLRELVGLGLIALSGVASAALMTWSVQDPSLSHATSRADPQHPRLSRRDQRRPDDADPRPRRDHADPADRGVGLAHADPSHLRPRGAAARLLAARAPCSPRALPAASSMAAPGRCRPASAASSAMRWCARRRSCSARPASSIASCSAPSCSPRWAQPSCSPPAGARGRARTRS